MQRKLNSKSGICDVALAWALVAAVGWTVAVLGFTKKQETTHVYINNNQPATATTATQSVTKSSVVVATNTPPAIKVAPPVLINPEPPKKTQLNKEITVIRAASGRAADILATKQ